MTNYFTNSNDCFNKNCPMRDNSTSSVNYCSCAYTCPNRCPEPYYLTTNDHTTPIVSTYKNKSITSNHTEGE